MKLNEVVRVMVRKMKQTTYDLLEILEHILNLEMLGEKCKLEK